MQEVIILSLVYLYQNLLSVLAKNDMNGPQNIY